MGKQIRLGNCTECDGFVLVDIADDTVVPLVDECRHCGLPMEAASVVDVPVLQAGDDEVDATVVCDNCGERWEDGDVRNVIDELGSCPSCKPSVYGSLPADS